eukprot:1382338-Ditylum_brightwellii.AAC.1
MEQVDDKQEKEVIFTEEWEQNNWKSIGIDDEISGPSFTNWCNGHHGMRPGVIKSFNDILQCIMSTTAMNYDLFKQLALHSSKYTRTYMATRNTNAHLGHPWINITTGGMICFFGIMLQISMSPQKMGGYQSYLRDRPSIHLGAGYGCKVRGFEPWPKDVISLTRLK